MPMTNEDPTNYFNIYFASRNLVRNKAKLSLFSTSCPHQQIIVLPVFRIKSAQTKYDITTQNTRNSTTA